MQMPQTKQRNRRMVVSLFFIFILKLGFNNINSVFYLFADRHHYI